jgi:hypothetical protein
MSKQEDEYEELLKSIRKSEEPLDEATKKRYAFLMTWAIVTAFCLIPVLFFGGGLKWIIGAIILAAVSVWIGGGSDDDDDGGGGGGGKKLLIALLMSGGGLAAGYKLGKKLEV